MQGFLDKVKNGIATFMDGRYGGDQLGVVLVAFALILSLLSNVAGKWLLILALAALVYAIVRMLSRDKAARNKENVAFLRAIAKPWKWCHRQRVKFQNRKTKVYVRCPNCHAEFALPKGKGHLRATCPKCGEKSEHTV